MKIYSKWHFGSAMLCFACAVFYLVWQLFSGFEILNAVMCIICVFLGAAYLVASFSYEASLDGNEDGGLDERSVMLRYESRSKAFDFWLEFSSLGGLTIVMLYNDLQLDALAYVLFGMMTPVAITLIVQTVILNRIDRGDEDPSRPKIKNMTNFISGIVFFIIAAVLLVLYGILHDDRFQISAAGFAVVGLLQTAWGLSGKVHRKRRF